jgi:RNA polymerase sigma-70 factor (ECF subfamily)
LSIGKAKNQAFCADPAQAFFSSETTSGKTCSHMLYWAQRRNAQMLAYMSLMDSADDKSKFERVYQSYKGLMFYTANRILNNPQDAEDAVHTAFVKIAENISKIQEAVCPKTKVFVVTIVENTAIDLYRKKKRLNIIDFPEGLPEAPVDLDGGTMLAACMARLPVRYRQVLLLKYSYGFSNKELAKLLGVTEANAIKLGQRAKEKFQEICEEEGVPL